MDSMRSLNRSLPTSGNVPPDQLIQAFKQAALSVTNLYKSAAGSQEASRQAGYQDALDDLLKFLDNENIGLQDGEGWRVREWATVRYDGAFNHTHSESEDETGTTEQGLQSNSSAQGNSEYSEELSQEPASDDIPPAVQDQPVFRFTAGEPASDNLMQSEDQPTSSSSTTPTPVRSDVKHRGPRNTARGRPNARGSHRNISGTKRRLPFPDFSEIFNAGFDRKDGSEGSGGSATGSKRGRFV